MDPGTIFQYSGPWPLALLWHRTGYACCTLHLQPAKLNRGHGKLQKGIHPSRLKQHTSEKIYLMICTKSLAKNTFWLYFSFLCSFLQSVYCLLINESWLTVLPSFLSSIKVWSTFQTGSMAWEVGLARQRARWELAFTGARPGRGPRPSEARARCILQPLTFSGVESVSC